MHPTPALSHGVRRALSFSTLLLVATGCTASVATDADGGAGGSTGAGGQAAAGGDGQGNGTLGGQAVPFGGTPGPAGGTPGPAGGTPGPAGGTPGPAGGTPGTGGTPVTPGPIAVEGDAEIMGLVQAEEAACQATCGTYDMCGWLDSGGDPPETVDTCRADCTYAEEDLVYLTNAASRDALVTVLNAAAALDDCVTALSCDDMAHYFEEDVSPYPCETEETAYYAALDAAFPTPDEPMFACADGNGEVPESWRCDGQADCEDGSDEQNCPQ